MKSILLAGVGVISGALAASAGELVVKPSAHSVTDTINRLEAAVEKAGAKVFARVDHAKGADSVGSELPPNQMLMFGNPKLGTPAMQAGASMGLDLPIRVVAYEDADGKVHVAYHDPASVAALHGIPADHPVIAKMTGALGKLTGVATAE
ncbi:MAG: DUF302 domain-containing protein [Pseudomonadota bacterium]